MKSKCMETRIQNLRIPYFLTLGPWRCCCFSRSGLEGSGGDYFLLFGLLPFLIIDVTFFCRRKVFKTMNYEAGSPRLT